MNELKSRAERILRVEQSRQQIVKNTEITISQNNSRAKELKENNRRVRDDDRTSRPPRDKAGDKRKGSDYFDGLAKRFKFDE